jgi:hypothetical protein
MEKKKESILETSKASSALSPEQLLEAGETEQGRQAVKERLQREAGKLPAAQREIILNLLKEQADREPNEKLAERLGIGISELFRERSAAFKKLRRLRGLRGALKLYKSIESPVADFIRMISGPQRIVISTSVPRIPAPRG